MGQHPARHGHSPALSVGHSNVGYAQIPDIEVQTRSGKSSAIADIEMRWVLRQQCGGLLTVAASSRRTAAFCISELTLSTRYCRSCICAVCPLRHHKPSFVFVLVPGTSLRSGERLCADSGWAYSASPHLALCTALTAEVVPRKVKSVGRRTADFWKRRFRRSHWYLREHSCKMHCGTFAAQQPAMWAMT
jgi:hypothetical protein